MSVMQRYREKERSCHTCGARVFRDSERVSIFIRVHGEEAHPEGGVLGEGRAVLKVLQVDAQLVVGLDGECVDPLHACQGKEHQSEPLLSRDPLVRSWQYSEYNMTKR